jgi:hypothetical protein
VFILASSAWSLHSRPVQRPASVRFAAAIVVAELGALLALTSCSSTQLPKGMVGRIGLYDYSPSVIQTGTVKQFWWCGLAENPALHSQKTDAILYESLDSATGHKVGPITVLAETPGKWDAELTCNPKVIGGTFSNPLGDGETYQYAMYYVGIENTSNNNIGVAFSHDGIAWKKYPEPVIRAESAVGYGVGQPSLYNADGKAGITMFYEDWFPNIHHVKATSTDGVHFSVQGTITLNGLDVGCEGTWGDIAYDLKTGYWYALFNRDLRDPSTTAAIIERGEMGVELYRIPDSALMTGAIPWESLATFDTNSTGFESNFIGAIVHDTYGNVNVGAYPTIQMYISVSNPQTGWKATVEEAGKSGDVSTWDIAPMEWTPNASARPLNRYYNRKTYVVTTGWIDTVGGFEQQSLLGHVYEGAHQGATTQLYACRNGATDYFISTDPACEGKRILGRNGFAYSQPGPEPSLVPLYRCRTAKNHFVSQDPKCEGQSPDGFLAYVLP